MVKTNKAKRKKIVLRGWAMVLSNGKGWIPCIFQNPRHAIEHAFASEKRRDIELAYVELREMRLPLKELHRLAGVTGKFKRR